MSEWRVWMEEEMVLLADLAAAGTPAESIAAEFGRSVTAILIRLRRVSCPVDGMVPTFGRSTYAADGVKLYWTRERVLAGLRLFAATRRGQLPTSSGAWNGLKKGHPEWPPAARVLEYCGTFPDAWGAAGAASRRYHRSWVPWTAEDDNILLDNAGEMTLERVALKLNRSWAACKRRLYDLGAGRARDVSGHMSAQQVAREYGCPVTRVTALIANGELKAHRVQGGHYWRIDPLDAERVAARLRAPKATHRVGPPDTGDYRQRLGYRRLGGHDVPITPAARAADERKRQKRREEAALRLVIARWEGEGRIRDFGVAAS